MQKNVTNSEKNKKGKIKFLLVGTFLIIGIAIGLFIGYKKLNNDPVVIYKDTINNFYDLLNNSLKDAEENLGDFNPTKEPFVLKLNAKLDSDIAELKNFTGLNYSILLGLDYNNKKMNIEGIIKEDDEKIISGLLAVINKNIYLKAPEVLNKTLDLGEQDIWSNIEFENNININYEDYYYILKEFKNILINSLDKDKFEIKEDTIEINNKKYNAKKVIYNLDKENLKRTIDYIKSEILKDDKLINSLANISNSNESDIKNSLNTTNYSDNDIRKDIDIILYTDKLNKLIAGAMILENEEIIKFDCLKDELNFKIINEDIEISVNKDNKNNYRLDYILNMEDKYECNFEIKNVKVSNDIISANITFSLNSQNYNIVLDGSYSIEKKDLENIDVTNSTKIDEISNEDGIEILEKISTIMERFGLSEIFNSLM